MTGPTGAPGSGANASLWSTFPAVSDVFINNYDLYTTGGSLIVGIGLSGATGSGQVQTPNITSYGDPTAPPLGIRGVKGLNLTAMTSDVNVVSTAGNINSTANGVITDTAYGEVHTITNNFEVTCDGGLNPITTPNINLVAKNGNGGQINISADPGSIAAFGGAVNITANGGTILLPTDPPTSVTVGGEVNIIANSGSGGLYTLTSAVNIVAAGVNSYAGAIPPVGSLAGYNFIYGNAGVSICAGLPSSGFQLPFTTYLYGVGSLGFTGVRLESPNGIGMLSPVYATDIYPFDGTDLTIQGRSAPSANVVIKDCAGLTMTSSGNVNTDFLNSLSSLGIFYKDSLYPQTSSQGLYSNFLRPPIASAPGVPNLVITNNPFGGNTNYVEISGADTIAFDATGSGKLLGVQSINNAPWPPPTGDASLWSQYAATSVIDVSGYGLIKVGDLSGVTSINGGVYPPVTSSADWSLYPALQSVDISNQQLINVNNIGFLDNGTIISAGQLSIFADTSAGNINIATNGGGDVNIGTGNAGSINIQTLGAGNNLNLSGDTATLTAGVQVTIDTPIIDVVGADIQNVSNITNEATNLLTVQSTANLTVSAETALTLVSDSADVTIQSQTGVAIYAATGNVTLTADSGEIVVQDSVLNMNTHKITNLTAGSATADAVNYGQLTFRDSTEFYVSSQGSDLSGNGSILAPFLTIQKAITQAELISSAAFVCSINVASGHYTENLTFNVGYVVLNGTLQSQTGNEVCEITGSITINCTGPNDVFNRQVSWQGWNITCGAGQSITNTSTSSHTVSFQDCKIFVNSVCYNSTATCADARTYFTNVEVFSTNAANVSPVITTNVGLVELERLDFTVDGNAIGILIGGTSVLSRCSLSTLESTNAGTTLLPLLSFTSTTTSAHSLGNVAFAFTSAVAKTATNAVYINSGIATAIIMLNNVFTLAGTASSTNYCIGYNGTGSPTIAGVNNTSLNVNVALPQTTTVQSGITQIQYTNIDPPVLGTYSSSIDQTMAVASTPQALTFNTSQNYHGTLLVAGTRIYVGSQGNYAVNYACQLQNTGGLSIFTQTFLKKNGTNVANSTSNATITTTTAYLQTSPQIVVQMNGGDYIEVWMNGPLTLSINAQPASGTVPASPSVILNIAQIR